MLADVLVFGAHRKRRANPIGRTSRGSSLDLIRRTNTVVLTLTRRKRISGMRLECYCQIAHRMRNACPIGGSRGRNVLILVRRTNGVWRAYPIRGIGRSQRFVVRIATWADRLAYAIASACRRHLQELHVFAAYRDRGTLTVAGGGGQLDRVHVGLQGTNSERGAARIVCCTWRC